MPALLPSPSSARRRVVSLGVLALCAATCRYPSTSVEVEVDTDVPASRTLTLRIAARRATLDGQSAGPGDPSWDRTWTRGGGGADAVALPASFGLVPGRAGAPDETISLQVEAEVAPGGVRQPAALLRRVARFAFVPRQTTRLRLFLPLRCADPTDGCTTVDPAACTIATRCEEQRLTCGDLGECVSTDVRPTRIAATDAGASQDGAPGADGGAALSGVARALALYSGPADVRGVRAIESQLGRPVDRIADSLGDEAWDAIASPTWLLDAWGPTRYAVMYAVPMLPASPAGTTLAQGAAGAYDDYFATLARLLVARGQGDAVLRLGREVNGNWWREYGGDDPASWAAYYRRVVSAMRAVPGGASLRFVWSVSVRTMTFHAADAWPGDAYVDYVGLSVEDSSWAAGTYPIPSDADDATRLARADAAWADRLAGDSGLDEWSAFAAAHGKPMVVVSWALAVRPDGHGGGDNPRFVEQMASWIAAHDVAFHVYYDYDPTMAEWHALSHFPNATARFVSVFGVR